MFALNEGDSHDHIGSQKNREAVKSRTLELEDEVVELHVGDAVMIKFPKEKENPELHGYLHYYFPHLKGRKGIVTEVLPYKKLQYKVVFNVKSEVIEVLMYHVDLEWVG